MPLAKSVSRNSRYRRQSFWVVAGIGTVVILVAIFGSLAIARFQAAGDSWQTYTSRAITIREALASLDRNIGYGGFIHNFKNLVLRRDLPRYQDAIARNLSGVKKDLDRLDGLLVKPGDRAEIAQVRATFIEYANAYRKVPALISEGKSSAQIDAVVKVDDTAALAALRQLTAHNLERSKAAQQQAQSIQASALLFLQLGGLMVVATILAAAAVIILFQRRLVAANDAKKGFLGSLVFSVVDGRPILP